MQTELLKVTGMSCGGCPSKVTHALEAISGVSDVKVDGAIGVFLSPAEKRGTEHGPTAKEMQAKIGQLALEVDFLEVALGRVGDARAKR